MPSSERRDFFISTRLALTAYDVLNTDLLFDPCTIDHPQHLATSYNGTPLAPAALGHRDPVIGAPLGMLEHHQRRVIGKRPLG